jgi:hypothetical protein
MDIRQIKAIEKSNKERILKQNPNISERSGIYFLLREEHGFRYAYIGQAKHILSRLAQHLNSYQHIDLSLKKHGLYSEENPTGYKVFAIEAPIIRLDELEKKYILQYANAGYQMKNHTLGGQGEGKSELDINKSVKGYRQGVAYGYQKARKEVAHLFRLHLDYKKKSDKPNKNQEKAMRKFAEFLDCEEKKNE